MALLRNFKKTAWICLSTYALHACMSCWCDGLVGFKMFWAFWVILILYVASIVAWWNGKISIAGNHTLWILHKTEAVCLNRWETLGVTSIFSHIQFAHVHKCVNVCMMSYNRMQGQVVWPVNNGRSSRSLCVMCFDAESKLAGSTIWVGLWRAWNWYSLFWEIFETER